MQPGKKLYFASDMHLGIPDYASSLEREKKMVRWLNQIQEDAETIYLIGDIFDFWFEYKHTVPKGFTRLLGKLAEIADSGIKLKIFTGNHDMWMFGYLKQELNAEIIYSAVTEEHNGKIFFIGHGDGLGPGDKGYKFLKNVFSNKICQWMFGWIHPNIGMGIANYWSRKSRLTDGGSIPPYQGEEKEWLLQFCKARLMEGHVDYFIFGHRHLVLDIKLNENSRYINTGDWITNFSYAVFDGDKLDLHAYSG